MVYTSACDDVGDPYGNLREILTTCFIKINFKNDSIIPADVPLKFFDDPVSRARLPLSLFAYTVSIQWVARAVEIRARIGHLATELLRSCDGFVMARVQGPNQTDLILNGAPSAL